MNLSDRETATVLAALRNWQVDMAESGGAINAGGEFTEHEPLTVEEIDNLCERINCGEREG